MNNKKSVIDTHKDSDQIKQYIYSSHKDNLGFRIIANELEQLFGLKIAYNSVKNWLDKNPPPPQYARTLNDDDDNLVPFNFCLYSKLEQNCTNEIAKAKSKLIVLMQCNLDAHIKHGKRLNAEYVKILKTVEEIEQLDSKNTPLQAEENSFKVEIVQPKVDLSKLSLDELKFLESINSKLNLDSNFQQLPHKAD